MNGKLICLCDVVRLSLCVLHRLGCGVLLLYKTAECHNKDRSRREGYHKPILMSVSVCLCISEVLSICSSHRLSHCGRLVVAISRGLPCAKGSTPLSWRRWATGSNSMTWHIKSKTPVSCPTAATTSSLLVCCSYYFGSTSHYSTE